MASASILEVKKRSHHCRGEHDNHFQDIDRQKLPVHVDSSAKWVADSRGYRGPAVPVNGAAGVPTVEYAQRRCSLVVVSAGNLVELAVRIGV